MGAITFVCVESAIYGIFVINVCLHKLHVSLHIGYSCACVYNEEMSERSSCTQNSILLVCVQSAHNP